MKRRKSKKLLKQKLWNKTNGKCAKCGKVIGKNNLIIAKYVPNSKEGSNHYNNLIPLCKRCAKYKKSKILDIDESLSYLSDPYKEYLRPRTIYSLNNSIYLEIMKEFFQLNSEKVHGMIIDEFLYCDKLLKSIGIEYSKLKKALIPTKETNNREVAFWFDSNKISNGFYGYEVFSRIIPLLDKESTCSILMGDYIDNLGIENKSQIILKQLLSEHIHECNKSDWIVSNQYYVIYLNRVTQARLNSIVDGLKEYDYFYGYTDLYSGSLLKNYLSSILINGMLKNKNKIIMANPDEEVSNLNIYGYPFEDNNYKVFSINEHIFHLFLSYKIETTFVREEDYSFSLNAIFPKNEKMNNLLVDIPKRKWEYLTSKDGKGGIILSLEKSLRNPVTFAEYINHNLCNNYIYNLRKNAYGILAFNICIALKMVNGEYRKTIIALKYFPKQKRLSLETIT